MKKPIAALFLTLSLAACGGGDDGSTLSSQKSLKLSFYGQPLVSGSAAVSHSQSVAHAASDATSTPAAAAATVQTLQDALVARGVPATVTAQVMDGTTLHQIVMGENNGLPPTPDQFGKDPSEWLIINFQLDDMVTTIDVPAQADALAQFAKDLSVFIQRAAVSGKRVFAVMPIQTCDADVAFTPSYNLKSTFAHSTLTTVGGQVEITSDHMGSDCRTPDAYLQNAWTQSVADDLSAQYQGKLATTK